MKGCKYIKMIPYKYAQWGIWELLRRKVSSFIQSLKIRIHLLPLLHNILFTCYTSTVTLAMIIILKWIKPLMQLYVLIQANCRIFWIMLYYYLIVIYKQCFSYLWQAGIRHFTNTSFFLSFYIQTEVVYRMKSARRLCTKQLKF